MYDAWSTARGTRCIAKTLRPDRAGDPSAIRRLIAEGRLIRRLAHPHIVRGYEVVPGAASGRRDGDAHRRDAWRG